VLSAQTPATTAPPPEAAQTQPATPTARYFTGTVTAVEEGSLTAARLVLGKPSGARTFLLNSETKYEGGKPVVSSRVTIRYVVTEQGDRAVHVIVRATTPNKK